MKFGSMFAGALLAAALVPGVSHAAIIVTDYAAWAAAVNGQYDTTSSTGLETFTSPVPGFSLPYGTSVTLANGAGDIVLQPTSGWVAWSNGYTGDIIDTAGQSETLTFTGTPVYAFGMEVSPDVPLFGSAAESFTITLSDGTTETIDGTYAAGDSQFIGFVGAGITSITISVADNPDFAFGDFVSAPEPVSLTVLASGMAMLGVVRRRTSRKTPA